MEKSRYELIDIYEKQFENDDEMKNIVERKAIQDQLNLDAEDRRGGPFPDWYLKKLEDKHQTLDGSEIPDPTVMEPPVGHQEIPSIIDSLYELIRREKVANGDPDEPDSPEEADDFDIPSPDDFEPRSSYEFEENFEPPADPPPQTSADPLPSAAQQRDSHTPQDPPQSPEPAGPGGVGGPGRAAPTSAGKA